MDDPDVLEEDKIEAVENLVDKYFGNASTNSDKERLVLDILWRHRDKDRQTKKKVTTVIIDHKNPVWDTLNEAPPPSDYTKLEKKNRPPTSSETNSPTIRPAPEWESWDEDEFGDTMSPFDILRNVLGEENTDEDIQHALEKNNFDIQTTLALLMDAANTEPVLDDKHIMCKYFVKFGECLRADCKYSHDLSSRICRFWLQGSCLAGDSCAFLHEVPQTLFNKLDDGTSNVTKKTESVKLTDDDFPTLGQVKDKSANNSSSRRSPDPKTFVFNPAKTFVPGAGLPIKPIPAPKASMVAKTVRLNRKRVDIPKPTQIPWLDSEYGMNAKYIAYRTSAARHAELRNKYLQLAADSWHKNNSGQASLLSKKGQKHNEDMVEDYFAGAELLYKQRLEPGSEIFIDLHGMTLEESIEKLQAVLKGVEQQDNDNPRPVYAICGIGHYFDRKKVAGRDDQLSARVRQFLDKRGLEYTEFSTEKHTYGKIIGIDPWSHI